MADFKSSRKELFLSYGREAEIIQFVYKLKQDLEGNGFSVWLDTVDIPAGSDWHNAIGTGLSQCKAIIPIITKKYVASRYCMNELYTADGDKKLVFPIMYEDVDFNNIEGGLGVKFVISSVNWTMCRPEVDDYNNSMSKLMQGMREEGLGCNSEEDEDDQHVSSVGYSHQPMPVIAPTAIKPFKVIPDVENPEGITSSADGQLIVSMVRQKVLVFNSEHEKILEMGGEPGLGMGKFLNPNGVAVDSDGNILIAGHYFIQKFSSRGKFLTQAGGSDPKHFQIDSPRGMAIGKGGRIYIAEQQKHRITILNSDLTLHKRFTDADRMLGSGHLNMPQGVAVNSNGDVYVADMMNHVIQVFDADGQFLFRFGKMGSGPGSTPSPSAIAVDAQDHVYVATGTSISIFNPQGVFIRAFGEYGSEIGKFNQIRALHIDRDGILYVGEWTSNRIQMFRLTESDISTAASVGGGGVAPNVPSAVHVPSAAHQHQTPALNVTGGGSGMVLIGGRGGVVKIGPGVVFRGHVAIQPGATVITNQGPVPSPVAVPQAGELSQASTSQKDGVTFAKSASAPCTKSVLNSPVTILEDIKDPKSIAVSRNGEIVVASGSKGNIMIFSEKFKKLLEKKIQSLAYAPLLIDDTDTILVFSIFGITKLNMELNEIAKVSKQENSGLKELTHPYGVAQGSGGRFYIAGAKKAHILNSDLTYHSTFAQKCQAFDIAVDSDGLVYLPVQKEQTVRVFSPDGEPLFQFGGPGRQPLPQFSLMVPMSIAIDPKTNNVYVGTGMDCVNVFDKEGKFLEVFGSKGTKPGEFSGLPVALCIDHNGYIYVGEKSVNRVQIFNLEI